MSTPLYSTDIIPMTSRPTLTVMDDGDYFVILDTSTGKISKILKTNVMTALKISYDNTTSELTAETVQAALDELVVNLGTAVADLAGAGRTTETVKGNADAVALRELLSNKVTAFQEVPTDAAYPSEKLVDDSLKNLAGAGRTTETVKQNADNISAIKGTGYTEGSLKTHEDRLDTLEGTGAGSVFKAIDDAVSPLAEVVDTNRLYSDSQYLDLKAKYDAQQIALNASKAELYTDDPILQYGAVEIIGKGYEADDTPIDVSANVVDGSLSMEQKGLTITNLVNGASIANLGTVTFASILNDKYYDTLNNAILTGTGSNMTATNNSGATANMAIYHLNAHGLQAITDTAILTHLLPYVDGTKSVGKMGMRVVNKNLIESVKQIYEGADYYLYTYLDGRFCARFTSGATIEKTPITFLPSQQYTVTFEYQTRIKSAGGGGEAAFTFFYTDGTKSVAGVVGNVNTTNWIKRTLTSTAGKTIRSVGVVAIDYRTYVYVSEDAFQLELGATSTTVEPYQEQLTFLPEIGNSLPNGVADSIKTVADGWEHTKRVGSGALSAEKLENSDFASASGTDWAVWTESAFGDSSITNVGGKPRLQSPTGSAVSIGQAGKLTVGRLYRIVVDLTVTSGTLKTDAGVPFANLLSFGNGVTTIYAIATGANLVLVRQTICDVIINSVSIKEIATTAGTPLAISAQTQVYDDGTNGYYQLATPVTTHYDLPHLTLGKTIHRFAGEEKIALYGTGLIFSENVLSVLSAIKFVSGVMTDITSLATITEATVTFSSVSATDVVYVKVKHDVDRPLGILEHTPAVSNTASRLASLEARVSALEV